MMVALRDCAFQNLRLPRLIALVHKDNLASRRVASKIGIKFEKLESGYLNRCVKSGKLLFTSGHTSKIKGRLGKDLKVEDGYKSAIPAKLRWRAWAKNPEGITGDELLRFVNDELFPKLKELPFGQSRDG